MLQDLVNKPVFVRLKWGQVEYKGTLVSVDSYMNLQLSGTEEYVSDKPTGLLGQVLIRCVMPMVMRGSGMRGTSCPKSHVDINSIANHFCGADATMCSGSVVRTKERTLRCRDNG